MTSLGPRTWRSLPNSARVMDAFQDITAVGEVGDDQKGLEIHGPNTPRAMDRLHMCYGFEFPVQAFSHGPPGIRDYRAFSMRLAPNSWACWAYSNHDVERHTSRWGLSDAAQRAYLALMHVLARVGVPLSGRGIGLWKRPMSRSRTCRILTAFGSGPRSRGATGAARRWSGRRIASMAGSARASRGCRLQWSIRRRLSRRRTKTPAAC